MHPSLYLHTKMEAPKISLISDLRVEKQKLMMIRPHVITERRSLFLSNIDQKHAGYVRKFVHVFSGQPEIPFDAIIFFLSEALSRLLVAYDFMSGRLRFNSEQGRFEIDCNAAGVPSAVCTSQLSVQELGDMKHPNPAFTQLCPSSTPGNLKLEDEPLLAFQMTRFKCGSFALGTTMNQCLMDGFAVQEFIKNFSHLITKRELAFVPDSDRSYFKARSPLQIKYDHGEFLKSSEIYPDAMNFSPCIHRNKDMWYRKMALQNPSDKHVYRLFSLSRKMLEALKMKAKDGGLKRCTRFMAALAFLWRARAAAIGNMEADDISTVQFAVDIRSKVMPPLPREFAGNAAVTAYAKASARELQEQPFAELVQRLQEGVDRITDDYVRSAIDCLELQNGELCLENGFVATSWSTMGFEELEFGGGGIRAMYGGPVVSGYVDVVTFLDNPKDEGGIQFSIALLAAHMDTFQKLIEYVDVITI